MCRISASLTVVSLGQNIKRLRWQAGFRTQKALADVLGVPQPRVSDWENDRYAVLETLTLVRIAKGLRCSIDQLLAGVDPDYDLVLRADHGPTAGPGAAGPPVRTLSDLPVVAEGDALPRGFARVRTPTPRTEQPGIVQWISRPGDLRDPNAYGVRVSGDSMLPAYRPNMIAIVAPGRRVQDGDEVYAQIASGERLIRLLRTVRNGCLLQSYNHGYRPLLLQRRDIRSLGVIVSARLPAF